MTDLTNKTHYSLISAVRKTLGEDARAESQETANREYERLLDLEAVKILSQVTLVVNGNETATEKLEALCALLFTYDDEDENTATKVDVKPKTASENRDYLIGRRIKN
jgi:hypothetical protein